MTRTYGALGWAKEVSGVAWWGMEVEPHVAIKIKRLFPRLQQGRVARDAGAVDAAADDDEVVIRLRVVSRFPGGARSRHASIR